MDQEARTQAASDLVDLRLAELAISHRERELAQRIERIQSGDPMGAGLLALLDLLEEQERAISDKHRLLHARIDGLRAEIGLPRPEGRDPDLSRLWLQVSERSDTQEH